MSEECEVGKDINSLIIQAQQLTGSVNNLKTSIETFAEQEK